MDLSITPQAQVQGKAQVSETGPYGVHDLMTNGLALFSFMCIHFSVIIVALY